MEVVSARPARNAAGAYKGCGSDVSGISEACEDCGSACEDGVDGISGIDGSGMGVEVLGKLAYYRGDSIEFSAEVQLRHCGHLCPATARCRTRTRFDSNSKVEFGLGLVTIYFTS
ncbi:unnamed protein product [Prunus armeniaca]